MTNKTALITGGSRGIGKCVVDLLRSKGWEVIAPTRAELDMNDANSGSDLLTYLHQEKFIPHTVIFCHGEWLSKPLGDQVTNMWLYQYYQRVINPMFHMRYFIREGTKCFVSVASTRGFVGGVDTGPYSAACAAQIATIQGYARELKGVRLNVVCPGLTNTDMGKIVKETGGAKPDAVAQDPLSVAFVIVKLMEGQDNGKVVRVVDGLASEAKWSW